MGNPTGILLFFFFHLILTSALVIFLASQGILHRHGNHFFPKNWFPPLLSSTLCAAILSLTWRSFAAGFPSKAFWTIFWLTPGLTFAAGLLLLNVGSSPSLAAGMVFLIASIAMSLHSCRSHRNIEYAARVLTVSSEGDGLFWLTLGLTFAAALYSCFAAAGIGGARASKATVMNGLFVTAILMSSAWTHQTIGNVLFASISRVKFAFFAHGAGLETRGSCYGGAACAGSLLAPAAGVVVGSAAAARSASGDSDEFLFSCAGCVSGLASAVEPYSGRWGFVHVAVHGKGFLQASKDVFELFEKAGLKELVASDLTASFCFRSAVGLGSICTLVTGSWAFAVQRSYVTELSLYAFFTGYFLGRISMAGQHASVAAYYVAYAENGRNPRFDSTIPSRVEELQRVRTEIV